MVPEDIRKINCKIIYKTSSVGNSARVIQALSGYGNYRGKAFWRCEPVDPVKCDNGKPDSGHMYSQFTDPDPAVHRYSCKIFTKQTYRECDAGAHDVCCDT